MLRCCAVFGLFSVRFLPAWSQLGLQEGSGPCQQHLRGGRHVSGLLTFQSRVGNSIGSGRWEERAALVDLRGGGAEGAAQMTVPGYGVLAGASTAT